ncbi:MAG TPA: LysM peptidoglycan-binding domain-containing protein [Planctomycetaceae bacterium]|nr:LysM peptidoglycan-binding domain-containing protein [Planctomycetaceae bacterium]
MTTRTLLAKTGLLTTAVLGLTGCTMSMSGGPYGPPPSARRPMMAPTAGYYAPAGPQTVSGPVAIVPTTMTASTATPTLSPTAAAPIASAPTGPTAVATYYHVRQGDTLSAIAQRYGQTVEDIRSANKINGNNDLAPGQMVLIPNQGTAIR